MGIKTTELLYKYRHDKSSWRWLLSAYL